MVERPRPGVPVYGPSWRRHGERRQRAARIARSLRPVAHVLGGLVSTELAVRYRGRWYRPDVGVVLDDPPVDGVLCRAPTLVVCLGGPLTGRDWVRAGADVVWSCDDEVTVVQLTRRGSTPLAWGQWLAHPAVPALRIAARELAAGPAADARIGA